MLHIHIVPSFEYSPPPSMGDEEDDCDEVWRDTGRPQLLEKLEYKQDKSLCAARYTDQNSKSRLTVV